jgi:hypothetical protein
MTIIYVYHFTTLLHFKKKENALKEFKTQKFLQNCLLFTKLMFKNKEKKYLQIFIAFVLMQRLQFSSLSSNVLLDSALKSKFGSSKGASAGNSWDSITSGLVSLVFDKYEKGEIFSF